MTIQRLKTLIAVSEQGSFIDAARVVHRTQAAVSMQMKGLEDDFMLELFDRSKRPPELNPAGRALIPKAREIILSYENMIRSATGEHLFAGELTIGAVPTTLAGLIPQTLVRFRETFPDLRVRIVPGLSDQLQSQLERGFLDAAVITKPMRRQQHLNWRYLANEPMILLAPSQAEGTDPIEMLNNYPFIRFNRQAWVGQQIDEWIISKNIRVQDVTELDNLEAITVMVYHNLGVSIVPLRCVFAPSRLPIRRISLGRSIKPRTLGLVSSLRSPKESLIDATFQTMSELIEDARCTRVIEIEE